MKTTIIYNGNHETKLDSFVVSRGDFESKGKFITFCSRNKVNGDWTLLWNLFNFSYTVRLYRAKTDEAVRWED
jgi:hypothetical protein